ncbi:hypothetical protein FA95DRAFT_1563724 [Auriscalpium vulgare]|uniref:Uncharacterized protein n=1 Tax=Auriscalpium vulgare TaxID=40419 RepID=A0ACB8RHP8_9AGAM|nr:hypothetical protein FA95DRAFT_1563724 [Auriscalpium vulgare]
MEQHRFGLSTRAALPTTHHRSPAGARASAAAPAPPLCPAGHDAPRKLQAAPGRPALSSPVCRTRTPPEVRSVSQVHKPGAQHRQRCIPPHNVYGGPREEARGLAAPPITDEHCVGECRRPRRRTCGYGSGVNRARALCRRRVQREDMLGAHRASM